ncbi:MAG TPA: TonB-dependent receptor [Sphingomonas sp.]|nr:TonB-dependent receptor [Sphingomonas sp.]
MLTTGCLAAQAAYAQDAQPSAAADDQNATDTAAPAPNQESAIVVTGSRIRRTGADSPSPLTILSSADIKAAGTQEIADVVNQLPSLAVTQTNQTSNLAGNPGVNALDLRGLGTQRTLVLVDGRRQVPAIPGTSAVDVSNIPSSLVERVEIVTGGASALYGADAVAGVANFILKQDYEGIDSNLRYSGSTRGDFDTYSYDLLAGTNFADGRGNITGYAFYENQPGEVRGEDRPWTAGGYPIYARRAGETRYFITDNNRNINSADAAQVILGGKLYSIDSDGSLRDPVLGPGGFVNVQPVDLTTADALGTLLTDGGEYNSRYAGLYLSVPSERFSSRVTGNYEFSDALKLFVVGSYARNKAEAEYGPLTAFGSDMVQADSPFITDAMIAANGGSVGSGVYFARRFMEVGHATTDYDRELAQGTIGLEGDFRLFSKDWNYSAYYAYGETRQRVRDRNQTAYDRWYLGLDSTAGPGGEAICRSTIDDPGNGCVAINPFVPLTQEMIDYIQYSTDWSHSKLTQEVASGYVSGGLFDLPGGTVQAVLGAEYRRERNHIGVIPQYDAESPSYDPTIGTTATGLVGGYSVKEAFGELHVPILSKTRFFDTLSIDGAVRFSDYSTAGTTTTYKLGGEWAPTPDLRFRATWGQAVRAPNIGELYTANSISGLWITDPCNEYNLENRATRSEYTAANCAAINPAEPPTYWEYRDIISKGNLALQPETAKTLTVGAVLQPRFIPNLSITVDYYNIDLRGAIDEFGAQTIINKCVDAPSLDNDFCALVTRDAAGDIQSVVTQSMNLAKYVTRGIDISLAYSVDLADLGLGDHAGRLAVDSNYSRLIKREYTLDPSDPNTITNYTGVFGSPKWKGVTRTTYSNDDFGITWSLRHYSSMRPTSTVTSETYDGSHTPDIFYNDFTGYVDVTPWLELSGGLLNAFDKAPPRIPGAESGGSNYELSYQAGVFDVIGRTFFVALRFHR